MPRLPPKPMYEGLFRTPPPEQAKRELSASEDLADLLKRAESYCTEPQYQIVKGIHGSYRRHITSILAKLLKEEQQRPASK